MRRRLSIHITVAPAVRKKDRGRVKTQMLITRKNICLYFINIYLGRVKTQKLITHNNKFLFKVTGNIIR